ncbi:hypothetical protein VaNZ11_004389 [Volvox africanus]|uniref:Protein cereblon n=1 Tax=Volvox africanus TaxID=51714 RepID=A0ABQ5RW70_9CHLO|nr:hypothetical protein VaNZ11_004389 [Volvox africanus]
MLKWTLEDVISGINKLGQRLKTWLIQASRAFYRCETRRMAEQSGSQSPLAAAGAESSSEDEDEAARGGMERVSSFDLDAADGGTEAAPRHFDPNTVAQHRYLGDVDELAGSSQLLEEGATYVLPLFPLSGVVLLPGEVLPLFLHSASDILKLERALRLPAGEPTARLIAVTHESWHSILSTVGCTAEVRRMRRNFELRDGGQAAAAAADGGPWRVSVVAVVARGRQRLLLDRAALNDTFRVRARVLPEGLAEAPPRQMVSGAAFWDSWATRPFDVPSLAVRVQQLCSGVLPQIARKFGSSSRLHGPLSLQRYTYWLASNLPLGAERRQQLLECLGTAERLRLILGWLTRLGVLACKYCGATVAHCSSALLMSSEGAGGAFVNAHGFVHDIATFRSVQGLSYQGQPETAHSWFPGYAWTIANCARCRDHLGWRFTACSEGLRPSVFWGLRRSAILCPELQRPRTGGGLLRGPEELLLGEDQRPVLMGMVEAIGLAFPMGDLRTEDEEEGQEGEDEDNDEEEDDEEEEEDDDEDDDEDIEASGGETEI